MNKGLFAFFLSGTVVAIVVVLVIGIYWDGFFERTDLIPEQSTIRPTEVLKIIEGWPVAMAEVDNALREYRAIGGSRYGESAIRLGVQANIFSRLGWPEGRAEYLISYLFMLRNALLKNSEQHRTLGYFMEHYERNEAVSSATQRMAD